MVAAVHVLEPGRVHGDLTAARARVRPATMAAEGVLHDLGIIHMLSSDSQGMGRAGEVVRRAFQNADVMKRVRGVDAGGGGLADNDRVLRHLAKVTINPAIVHGLSHDVGALTPGRLADCVLWRPELFGVRPELVVKMGVSVWGASGDPDATTMLCEPVVVRRQVGAHGAAAARLSTAFLAQAAMDADLPTTRPRSAVRGCRDVTAAEMVRNDVLADVTVSPDGTEVRVDGEPVGIAPVDEVALSWRYLLG
jgi:urease subunit alpha